jgi:hypothetical protein
MSLPSQATVTNLARLSKAPTWFPRGFLDHFVRKIPFEHVAEPSPSIEWNRTAAGPFPAVGVYTRGAVFSGAAMDTDKVTATWVRIGEVAEVDVFDQWAASNVMDQLEVQVGARKVGCVRALGSGILEGTGGGTALEGFKFHIVSGQTIGAANGAANGGAPTLEDLHKLVYLATASDGCVGAGADCLVAAPKAIRFIIKLLEDKGTTPHFAFDSDLGVPVLHFNGIPVYLGQNATNETKGTGTNLTSIWAVKLTGPTGVRVLHSGGDSSEFGIEVSDIPTQATISKLGRFVGGYYSVLVPEQESLARLDGCNLSSLI